MNHVGEVKEGLQPVHGGRKFYEMPTQNSINKSAGLKRSEENGEGDPKNLANYINSNIIGNQTSFITPFGRRRIIYCDHVASGRSVKFIEDFLR